MATNAEVDTAAAAVAAPYGPLVRVTDVTTLPAPNANIRIEFESALGTTVYLSYNQLGRADTLLRLLRQAHPIEARAEDLKNQVATVRAITNAFSSPHTLADIMEGVQALWDVDGRRAHY